MARKRKCPKLKTDDVHYGDKLQTFKVRCSLECAFYAFVEAHHADEAEIVAENWCRGEDKKRDDGLFWDSEATYKHSKFERYVVGDVYDTREILELKEGRTTPQGYRDWNALAAFVRKTARKVLAYAKEVDPVEENE